MVIEPDNRGGFIVLSDIIISPSFVTTLEFAVEYDKLAIVYNPLSNLKRGSFLTQSVT
ncbi:hypothetical protein MCHI_001300, partial [Candidatus Magnetoovum chiemensis]